MGGVRLEKNSTIGDYHVNEGAVIELRIQIGRDSPFVPPPPATMKIHVKMLSGITHSFVFGPLLTVSTIQNAIQLKTGVHPEDQLLIVGGRQMEGHRTLGFYQLKDGATLQLELRQPRRHRDSVPRGTFEEPAMVAELKTRATTIRKSMIKINQLHKAAGGDLQDMTKLVQWMNRKEKHANEIIKTMGEFCMCQRVERRKFDDEDFYVAAFKAHHDVMHAARETKKSADFATANTLDEDLKKLFAMYQVHQMKTSCDSNISLTDLASCQSSVLICIRAT
ncbi:hypothetical protein FisN_31Hu014 [Fistulifera solaris]|uniref:Ubiquitin-like domain-containing protein n=1 Tax=Fistulifera solaris TaxID=1519565 RepID=A0A1Z5JW32_FISSO|nr:hypothetical protein FisN_31Hu014 [Fistulifera solaris]|eukprot:GAX18233.1 hypothetical protein FisN_31Hu014 [Fistulifera solaris]